jgi:hypothetical protein
MSDFNLKTVKLVLLLSVSLLRQPTAVEHAEGVSSTMAKVEIVKDTDYGHPMKAFSLKSQTLGVWRTNWAGNFGAIVVFSDEISAPILVQ